MARPMADNHLVVRQQSPQECVDRPVRVLRCGERHGERERISVRAQPPGLILNQGQSALASAYDANRLAIKEEDKEVVSHCRAP